MKQLLTSILTITKESPTTVIGIICLLVVGIVSNLLYDAHQNEVRNGTKQVRADEFWMKKPIYFATDKGLECIKFLDTHSGHVSCNWSKFNERKSK